VPRVVYPQDVDAVPVRGVLDVGRVAFYDAIVSRTPPDDRT
jgi:hypothetical protein